MRSRTQEMSKPRDSHVPEPKTAQRLARRLLRWYGANARVLPWRVPPGSDGAADPYRIWLSEIMLQQTVVAAVIPYFETFISRWPTVEALASGPRDEVMAAWAGLGYYSRARNLHACAQLVAGEWGGTFPRDEAELQKLPGIGPYTAAAIAAIAFGRAATVIDGNVDRVMVRMFGVRQPIRDVKAKIRGFAEALTPKSRAGDYAQGVMDLGATICTPKSPSCEICPWAEDCVARTKGIAADLPAKPPRKKRPTRYGAAFVLTRPDGAVLLRRRGDKGLLGGMMEFPTTDWGAARNDWLEVAPLKAKWKRASEVVMHTFTHFHLELEVYVTRITAKQAARLDGEWVAASAIDGAGLPTVMKKVASSAGA